MSAVSIRHYLVITASYWAFTITDGAIRMLVVLYFHLLGYSPLEIALLFLFYEIFGVVTNLTGGWLAARIGLNRTMHIGMALQIGALLMLTVPDAWLSVAYVMLAQALSGIAKDLNKMSAKAGVKLVLPQSDGPQDGADARLFRWVAILTGSKNALKGVGFFVGGLLLALVGFRGALLILSAMLAVVLVVSMVLLPLEIGKTKFKAKFRQVFANTPEINWLSGARLFLFGARDVWFVVGLPVYLTAVVGWDNWKVGGFLALWVIGYGAVQALAPQLFRNRPPDGVSARLWAVGLAALPAAMAIGLMNDFDPEWVVVGGLLLFGVVFAVNSALHSYLILHYADHDKVAMNVGFYYMANAGGRLVGTVLSGWVYQTQGLVGCLWWSTAFVLLAALLSLRLPSAKTLATP
jgi:predicted MFS family arabinose efflux permease